ncbi:ThiF family adenylyltransferase [Frondihabitans cladoniiphilus]|uniref:Adenylyltransferase/sulfurtransferase MoeZ n=1 Tax=Frondihabitans cladoniiphilus TaxID=715785 RepID=A0ABP8VTS1_9MICO
MPKLPPIVAGGVPAAPSVRYSRSTRLPGMGLDGQARLTAARVLVVGAGGLGSPVIQYLATSGVGTLGIVDDDVVDLSNLQRQVLYRPDQVGLPKARAAAEWVRAVNPDVTVHVHAVRLGDATASILDDYDLIVDGSDSFDTCYVVADAAAARGLPVVWGSVSRYDGQASVFWDAAPDGRGVDYRDLHPEAPAGGWDESCADVGVLGPLCGTVGSVLASEAVKLLTGVGEPLLGRIVTIDAAGGTWRESRIARSAERRAEREAVVAARGGQTAESASAAVVPVASLTADELEARLTARAEGRDDFVLLDVRATHEQEAGMIPGAVAAAGFGSTSPVHPPLDLDVPVVVYCARGPRSAAAARLLADEGYAVADLSRGMLGWTLRPSALAAGADAAARGGRVPLPLGDIDPEAFHPNRHS